jgi:AcrR family transcriptional regulator
LRAAIVAAVANHGYATTTVRELAGLAGVPEPAFFELFAGKEECFLAAQEVIVEAATARALSAYEGSSDAGTVARSVLAVLVDCVVGEPDAAYLAVVAPETVGPSAVVRAERGFSVLEGMLNERLASSLGRSARTELLATAILAGCRRVADEYLQAGGSARLPFALDAVSAWVTSYCGGASTKIRRGDQHPGSVEIAVRVASLRDSGVSPRARMLRAAAELCASGGLDAVTVEGITQRARVSTRLFHTHFRDEREALLVCYERASRHALGVTLASFQAAPSWPQAIHASIRTLTALLAAGPEFARLSLVEALAADAAVRERADMRLDAFSALLDPGFHHSTSSPPSVVASAISGGVWGVLQRFVMQERTVWLPSAADDLTYFALTPFVGPEKAAAVVASGASDAAEA